MKLLLFGIVFLVFVLSAAAFLTVEITAPTAFSYQETLEVNVSAGLNITGFPFLINVGSNNGSVNSTNATVGINILNHSGSGTDTYGILASSTGLTITISNGTTPSADAGNFWNFTATLTNERQFIKVNFTNVSRKDDGSFGGVLTAERVVQIDTSGNILNLGGFDTRNISLDDGTINMSGLIVPRNISLYAPNGVRWICGVNNSGHMDCRN